MLNVVVAEYRIVIFVRGHENLTSWTDFPFYLCIIIISPAAFAEEQKNESILYRL